MLNVWITLINTKNTIAHGCKIKGVNVKEIIFSNGTNIKYINGEDI
ncbi:hypothetical protein [Spiroplasma gladiatoris]|nr:hypothetical protein [Spiroplasma gladiatoris]